MLDNGGAWQEYVQHEVPETVLPSGFILGKKSDGGDIKMGSKGVTVAEFKRQVREVLVLKALRPDRLPARLCNLAESILGTELAY